MNISPSWTGSRLRHMALGWLSASALSTLPLPPTETVLCHQRNVRIIKTSTTDWPQGDDSRMFTVMCLLILTRSYGRASMCLETDRPSPTLLFALDTGLMASPPHSASLPVNNRGCYYAALFRLIRFYCQWSGIIQGIYTQSDVSIIPLLIHCENDLPITLMPLSQGKVNWLMITGRTPVLFFLSFIDIQHIQNTYKSKVSEQMVVSSIQLKICTGTLGLHSNFTW